MLKREKVDGIPTIAMPRVGTLELVSGTAGCGKTQKLIEDVRELLAKGAEPSSILVLCATQDAAQAFSQRLGSAEVRVTTARAVALELLARPAAVALFGHAPRVLLPFEEDILLEDLKMSGVETERMTNMLAFFKRSMTEISDDHPDFLMDDDERAVMRTLRQGLELRGAMLEQQVSAHACRFLTATKTAGTYARVYVDDCQCLSRASLVLAALLARGSLCVAYDPTASARMLESYPYERGVEELLQANPDAHTVELDRFCGPREIEQALNTLREAAGRAPHPTRDAVDEAGDSVIVDVLPDASCEIEKVADQVVRALDRGLAHDEVYVAAPNDTWSSRIAQALAQKGIGSKVARNWTRLARSDADASRDARYLKVLTAILLAGDPRDDAAWRSWCAFGQPLAASGEIAVAAQSATRLGMRLHEVLASPDTADTPEAHQGELHASYQAGTALLARIGSLGRDSMLRVLTDEFYGPHEPVAPELLQLLCGTGPEDDAAALRACILDKMTNCLGWESSDASDGDAKSVVRIGDMSRLCGLSPRLVVFAGFVNGFFPPHAFFDQTLTPPGDVERAQAACIDKLCCALGKATDSAVFTAFTKIPCSEAEKLGVKIDRIGLENRVRTARVSPSIFCAYLHGGDSERRA